MKQQSIETKESSNDLYSQPSCSSNSAFDRLIDACKRKDLETIRSIVSDRPELLNKRDRTGRNLLHYSVVLVPDQNDSDLGHNSHKNPLKSNLQTQEDSGAKLNGQQSKASEHEHEARNSQSSRLSRELQCIDCLNYLTDRCDLKLWWQQDSDGLSLLHLAVISCNVPLVKYIIYEHPYSSKYPLVCTNDSEHHSPLHWSVITNDLSCVKLLINYAGVKLAHEPDLNGATPLHYATQTSGYPRYRRQLKNMLSCFHANHSTTQPVECKLKRKTFGQNEDLPTDMNKRRDSKATIASMNSIDGQLVQASDQLEVLQYLVALPGINLECVDMDRRTPLLWAASSGSRDAVVILLRHGANANSYDINRLSALHCAASHGFTDCLECLLDMTQAKSSNTDQVAQINQPDHLSCTPLFYAILSGNVDCVETLLNFGAKPNWQDAKGRTAAHFAALKGQLNSLKLLRECGADLWLASKQGDLPLHYAIKSGRQQVVKWLLDNSPYDRAVNAINNFGRAPVHLAILKNNVNMVEYLMGFQANLNQLVKIKERTAKGVNRHSNGGSRGDLIKPGQGYHYETAVDMATRLGFDDCLNLLISNGALPASKILSDRSYESRGSANARSLFELQSAECPSPIGFETSSSSASMNTIIGHVKDDQDMRQPKLSRTEKLIQGSDESCDNIRIESTGSGNLNGHHNSARNSRRRFFKRSASEDRHSNSAGYQRPIEGGVSYNNDVIDASIKCKVYHPETGTRADQNRSRRRSESGFDRSHPIHSNSLDNNESKRTNSGQEIITNVNVYTSPCSHCAHDQPDHLCRLCNRHSQTKRKLAAQPTIELYDSDVTTTSGEDFVQEDGHLRNATRDKAPMTINEMNRFVQPDQHLPVIFSEQERSTSEGSNEVTSTKDQSVPTQSHVNIETLHDRTTKSKSIASTEPRFDKRVPQVATRVDRYRDHVKSPVAEYINAPHGNSHREDTHTRASSVGRNNQTKLPRLNHEHQDYSSARPKIDLHRFGNDNYDTNSFKSRSLVEVDCSASQLWDTYDPASSDNRYDMRTVSRQTVTKGPHSSVENAYIATAIEKSIRKYKQETHLFEELQNLKRSQIRSGKANEALLVKRLIEKFSNQVAPFELLQPYHGPYTFKSYERFLYDQLRKLSQSNRGKLNDIPIEEMETIFHNARDSVDHNEGSDQDLKEEIELNRVINPMTDDVNGNGRQNIIEQLVSRSSTEEVDEKEGNPSKSLISHTEYSDDIQDREERLSLSNITAANLNEKDNQGDQHQNVQSDVAELLSSSIIVDALGNVSGVKSEKVDLPDEQDSCSETDVTLNDLHSVAELPPRSEGNRRKSVVNIGDRMEIVYHDVGIEIDKASDSESSISQIDKQEDTSTDRNLVQPNEVPMNEVPKNEPTHYTQDGEDTNDLPNLDEKYKERNNPLNDADERDEINEIQSDAVEMNSKKDSREDENKDLSYHKRRASSPVSLVRTKHQDHVNDIVPKVARRSISVTRDIVKCEPSDDKKVFNGYDLDKMRIDRCSARLNTSKQDQSERIQEEESSFSHANSREGEKTLSEKSTGVSANRVKQMVDSPIEDSDEGFVSRSTTRKSMSRVSNVINSPTQSSSIRKRLEMSHLPKGKYVVNVPIRDVKTRWSKIKAGGRRKLKEIGNSNNSTVIMMGDVHQTSDHVNETTNNSKTLDRLQLSLESESRVMAKSQSNLDSGHQNLANQEGDDSDLRYENFILLYEINKDSKDRIETSNNIYPAGDKAKLNRQLDWWCHKKTLRIVDVRALKRTLSLPESVIYSNDLLKRFNILKL